MNTYSSNLFPEERFQVELFRWLRATQPEVLVETGVATGTGSRMILTALDLNGHGHLHSVDGTCDKPFEHPKWTFFKGFSQDKLFGIFEKSGPWDFFLHDSDHECACQTFEYEVAWHFTKPGGYIGSDDFNWGSPVHFAWRNFLLRHQVNTEISVGCVRLIQKPISAPQPQSDHDWASSCIQLAIRMAKDATLSLNISK